jgi:hypothetical protein
MTITVAGSPVSVGDTLFSRRAGGPGTVTAVLDYAVVLRVNRGGTTRDYTVTEGGLVAGTRDVWWHPPLELDLGKGQGTKFNQIQALVKTLNGVL